MIFPQTSKHYASCVTTRSYSFCFCAYLLFKCTLLRANGPRISPSFFRPGPVHEIRPNSTGHIQKTLPMDEHNAVLKFLSKPQFGIVKVGPVSYREIDVPAYVRTHADRAHWDQIRVNVARREVKVGELMEGESSDESDHASTEAKSGETLQQTECVRGHNSEKREDCVGAGETSKEAQGCSGLSNVSTLTGKEDKRLEGRKDLFIAEEGPYKDASTGSWFIKLQVPAFFRSLVIGVKGRNIAEIKKRYGVCVRVEQGRLNFPVFLRAENFQALKLARGFLEEAFEERIESAPYTHYISLPLTDPRFQERFTSFRKQLLAAHTNLDEALFSDPSQLHITILLLRLRNEQEEARCREILESASGQVYDAVDTRSLVLHLKGLDTLNDDPSAAALVVTTPYRGNENDNETFRRINRLCYAVAEAIRAGGLISNEDIARQGVQGFSDNGVKQKLHATLMNTKFVHGALSKSEQSVKQKKRTSPVSFDATGLLSDFRLYDFFDCRVPSVELISRARYAVNWQPTTVACVRLP